ncbi:MAG: PQQ-dependent sugar dehydrogenase [Luteolibacter sp.]
MKPAYLALLFSLPIALSHAELATETVIKGLERPVWVGAPDGVSDKLWVMKQPGTISIIDLKTGEKFSEPFLKIESKVDDSKNEEGLLGLAFAPDFAESGRYYVNYTSKDSHSNVVRFTTPDGMTTDADSGETILRYKQDYDNHNGGWLDFGPDGMLWIGTGDGGASNDPKGRAQDVGQFLGKMLRLDVSGETGYVPASDNGFVNVKGALPEIHAIGLRNPWRCSFDRETGDFWIGDVGQNAWEEINFVEKGETGGKNFGWRLREGEIKTPEKKNRDVGGDIPENHHAPIYVYEHGSGPLQGLSVTGGFVYRGSEIPEFNGRYIFADYQNPRIWSFVGKGSDYAEFKDHTSELQPDNGRISLISSFGEGGDGELYLTDLTGTVYKIVGK